MPFLDRVILAKDIIFRINKPLNIIHEKGTNNNAVYNYSTPK